MTRRSGTGGRRSKGARDSLIVRVPEALGDIIRDQAEAAGMTINDFLAATLADAVGRPDLAPATDLAGQEALPMSA